MAAPTTTTLRILTERSDTKAEAPQAALSTYYFPPYQPPDLDRHPWASPKSNKERRGPTRRKGPVLVVEDDPAILSSVVDILEFEGYEVESATDGARGLEVLERTTPTLILLDMRMPVLNGWDFARIMKERGISVPVLVMTAAQDASRWAQEIGADGYIAKPFHLLDLLDSVEKYHGKED